MILNLFYAFNAVVNYIVSKINKRTICEENMEEKDKENYENVDDIAVKPKKFDYKNIRFYPYAYIQRYNEVEKILRETDLTIRKVVEFGCSELKFARNIKTVLSLDHVIFVDIDRDTLEEHKCKIEPIYNDFKNLRPYPFTMEVYEGSVTEYNEVLDNTDAVVCIELIEYLSFSDVQKMTANIFGNIQPRLVIMTTPNKDFNNEFNMEPNGMWKWQHNFEWSRQELQNWVDFVICKYPYYKATCETIAMGPFGTEKFGGCSQIVVFRRTSFTKAPVTVEHGIYKSVHDKQIYPYLTDDLIHEKVLEYISWKSKHSTNRHYFINAYSLKKSRVHYGDFTLEEFKKFLRYSMPNERLYEYLDYNYIQYDAQDEQKVYFPYIEGEIEYEEPEYIEEVS